MANANIVHSGYGFRCTVTEQNLPLTLGLDGSAVLERLTG
ncbi:acetyltransferase, partial [Enterobacter hormaechei]|nr:acetyltransferase [Enterobacter hormaechei]